MGSADLAGLDGAAEAVVPDVSDAKPASDAMPAQDLVRGDTRIPDVAPDPGTADLPADETEAGGPFDYLIVAGDKLKKTADAFADYRAAAGFRVRVRTVSDLAAEWEDEDGIIDAIRDWVEKMHEERDPERPMYLLIVGDVDFDGTNREVCVPADYWPGGWEGSYSDNFYADMDLDHVPDIAVGRLPIRDNAQGKTILDKVKKHESDYEVGPWNHRLHVYAGEGGFGSEIDLLLETVAQKGLESVPYDYDLVFAYRNPGSTYYYMPFQEKILDLVTDGAVVVTYIGHGGGQLDVGNLAEVVLDHRQAAYAFFACGTGDFVGPFDSDSETVLKQEGGPAAILASQSTTHPYGNAINAIEFENAVFVDRAATFGEAVQRLKWRSLYDTGSDMRKMIDAFAVLYMPEEEMEWVIEDHMYSYNLLGDPAMLLRLPQGKVEVEAGEAVLGQQISINGAAAGFAAGTAHVALVCERAKILKPMTQVEDPDAPESWPAVQENWSNAMDHTVAATEAPLMGGSFVALLDVPTDIPAGPYYVTAYVEDGVTDAVGSLAVKVKKSSEGR